jgi:hypothetical protein
VKRGRGFVSIFFGKQSLDDPDKLESRLELKYPPEAFIQHFWKNSREFDEGLRTAVAKWPSDPLLAPKDGGAMTAVKSHSEWVNFDVLARSGSHASIDFYHLSPLSISQLAKGVHSENLDLVPIVRVLTTIHEMARTMQAAEPVVAEVKRYLPQEPPYV